MFSVLGRDIKNLDGIRSVLESEGGAFSSEEQEAAFDTLNLSVPENLKDLGLYIGEVDALKEGVKSEIERLNRRVKVLESAKNRSKALIIQGLLALGRSNIKSKFFNAFLVKSKKVLPKEIDKVLLPKKYIITKKETRIDRRLLLADAKAGVEGLNIDLIDSSLGLRIL